MCDCEKNWTARFITDYHHKGGKWTEAWNNLAKYKINKKKKRQPSSIKQKHIQLEERDRERSKRARKAFQDDLYKCETNEKSIVYTRFIFNIW